MVSNLPVELTMAIIAYLPLSSIAVLSQLNLHWNSFINANRDRIYHKAAAWHGFIPSPSATLGELGLWYSGRSLKGVITWLDFCRRRLDIDKAWSAKAPSTITPHLITGTSVHRMKVDEKAGYILTTKSDGRLIVTDLNEGVVLWSLPRSHARHHAPCEYGEGFIVFGRLDGSKEVWRRSFDCQPDSPSTIVPESQPTTLISEFLSLAPTPTPIRPDANTSTSIRGHFQPWAHLHPPEPAYNFRLSYPFLGAAALDRAYLWDLRTGALVQTIDNTGLSVWNGSLGITYIELGPRHVFLCGKNAFKVFSKETGQCVLDMPSSQSTYGRWLYRISPSKGYERSTFGAEVVRHECVVMQQKKVKREILDKFIAVHISSCGRHLAALLRSSRLVIIRDFECAATEDVSIYDLTIEVQLGSPCFSSTYLAYENGRIAVATRRGIFIVKPDFSSHKPNPPLPITSISTTSENTTATTSVTASRYKRTKKQQPKTNTKTVPAPGPHHPNIEIYRIPSLANHTCLDRVSCFQMTDTGLFLDWDADVLFKDDEENERLFYSELRDEPQYAYLSKTVRAVLVDQDEADDDDGVESSMVLSVDFTPL